MALLFPEHLFLFIKYSYLQLRCTASKNVNSFASFSNQALQIEFTMSIFDNLCLGMAAVYSFFGITLAISPSFFWGPNSKFCYWTQMDESGEWFGRTLGLWMTAVTLSPWYAGVSKKALAKVYMPINVVFMYFFYQASFVLSTTGPAPQNILPVNMWWTQLPIAAAFLGMNYLALQECKGKDD